MFHFEKKAVCPLANFGTVHICSMECHVLGIFLKLTIERPFILHGGGVIPTN